MRVNRQMMGPSLPTLRAGGRLQPSGSVPATASLRRQSKALHGTSGRRDCRAQLLDRVLYRLEAAREEARRFAWFQTHYPPYNWGCRAPQMAARHFSWLQAIEHVRGQLKDAQRRRERAGFRDQFGPEARAHREAMRTLDSLSLQQWRGLPMASMTIILEQTHELAFAIYKVAVARRHHRGR